MSVKVVFLSHDFLNSKVKNPNYVEPPKKEEKKPAPKKSNSNGFFKQLTKSSNANVAIVGALVSAFQDGKKTYEKEKSKAPEPQKSNEPNYLTKSRFSNQKDLFNYVVNKAPKDSLFDTLNKYEEPKLGFSTKQRNRNINYKTDENASRGGNWYLVDDTNKRVISSIEQQNHADPKKITQYSVTHHLFPDNQRRVTAGVSSALNSALLHLKNKNDEYLSSKNKPKDDGGFNQSLEDNKTKDTNSFKQDVYKPQQSLVDADEELRFHKIKHELGHLAEDIGLNVPHVMLGVDDRIKSLFRKIDRGMSSGTLNPKQMNHLQKMAVGTQALRQAHLVGQDLHHEVDMNFNSFIDDVYKNKRLKDN